MKKFLIGVLIFASFFMAGCSLPAEEEAEEVSSLSEMQETEEEAVSSAPDAVMFEPVDLTFADTVFFDSWEEAEFSFFDVVPEEISKGEKPGLALFSEDRSGREWLLEAESLAAADMEAALKTAAEKTAEHYGMECEFFSEITPPSWQFIYTVVSCAEDADDFSDILRTAYDRELLFRNENNSTLIIEARFYPKNYRVAFDDSIIGEPNEMSAEFLYSYLYTAYDENAEMREYIQPEPEGSLLNGIVWPLESHTNLRKTWYADRDDGKRRHMGTDIWAAEDTEIYSSTNGRVTFVGEGGGMGYAVIVEDEYGYEYHYYHMVRLTDFLEEGDTVSAGDLIGHVGNTGNSALDHLHMAIVAPDGYYVNPYPYLEAVEP